LEKGEQFTFYTWGRREEGNHLSKKKGKGEINVMSQGKRGGKKEVCYAIQRKNLGNF